MLLSAVIVKNDKRRIKEISRTKNYYATNVEKDNISREIIFYKNEEAAKCNYPKPIIGIIYIKIDTENMKFFGKDNVPVLLKPKFSETASEYIFSFDEGIKDLHCKIDIINNSF